MQSKNSIISIILAGKHNLQLKLLQSTVYILHVCTDISLNALILIIHADFPHHLDIIIFT